MNAARSSGWRKDIIFFSVLLLNVYKFAKKKLSKLSIYTVTMTIFLVEHWDMKII